MSFKQKLKRNKILCAIIYFCKMIKGIIVLPFLKHDKMMTKYRNLHNGEKCFIVATGPSLTIEDLNKIKGHICFSVNSIIKSFNMTDWRPDYYVISDIIPFNSVKGFVKKEDFKQVFLAKGIGKIDGSIYFSLNNISRAKCQITGNYLNKLYPSKKLEKYFNNAPSVVFSTIQLAIYMGFKEIYLIGQDCNYTLPDSHSKIAQVKYKNKPSIKLGNDMIQVFENFSKFYSDTDAKIYNCTRGGMLESFPRKSLEEVLLLEKTK